MIRRSQIAALGLAAPALIASAAVMWSIAGQPIIRRHAQIEALREEINRLETQRVRLGGVERWRNAASDAAALRSDFFDAGAGASNIAKLQDLLRTSAASAGLTIISARPQTDEISAADRPPSVSLEMAMSGKLDQLAAFLVDVDRAQTAVLINRIDIASVADAERNGALNFSVTARGFTWPESAG